MGHVAGGVVLEKDVRYVGCLFQSGCEFFRFRRIARGIREALLDFQKIIAAGESPGSQRGGLQAGGGRVTRM